MLDDYESFDRAAGWLGAWVDLLWSYFPVFLVAMVLALVGKAHAITERSDLILASSVVFAEGSWRARKAGVFSRTNGQLVGLLGAVASTVLLVFVLLVEVLSLDALAAHVQAPGFRATQFIMVLLSVLYGLQVRVSVRAREEWSERNHRELLKELDALRVEKGLPRWYEGLQAKLGVCRT